ncbi:hypothetical protein DU80_17575 [Methanosarcina mazei]|jgi:hypothetical protein|uniref:Uncharacterized protein n=2 Tax=Methanosarcina mazei TaxID=2209 RepID=A0A0F8IFW1_METMZ|nr:hypothetical protein DU31_07540 [Methanosarcina mazei]KKG00648.1 hypothetical protein DU40_10225 [Methanosarcina mazei]KKG02639.1 hypothetical protein DU47_17695 [Methanosarcina mazei]KKG09960.1 hypothetical protein DU34_12640 [Methanosarcina mazei]KKG30813.1 hypothetical protein DU49_12060 [Methanosarcina mazei]
MNVNFCSVSKIKTVFLSFIASEIFILAIEVTFGIPLNAFYYMGLNFTRPVDVSFQLLFNGDEQVDLAGSSLFMKGLISILLWFLTSPALLIAIVVYILAPEDESMIVPDPYAHIR